MSAIAVVTLHLNVSFLHYFLTYQDLRPSLLPDISISVHLLNFQIRETVLTFISQNGQHQKLLKTKHFKHLQQLVVSSGQPRDVKDLMDYLISHN